MEKPELSLRVTLRIRQLNSHGFNDMNKGLSSGRKPFVLAGGIGLFVIRWYWR